MLDKIIKTKQEEVEQLIAEGYQYSLTVKERDIPSFPFVEALRQPNHSSALIAEVKKASPSKGVIRESFHPVEIAQAYQGAGADCLSVLTDVQYFQGHPSYIKEIKQHVSLPVLRKDFIIDSIQIKHSVELGADAILLIARSLSSQQLVEFYQEAAELGLDSLIEVASLEELEQVFAVLKPSLIGINNRDLQTFQTRMETTIELLPHIPSDVLVISESGIHSHEMVKTLEGHGVGGFLIGEHFMRQEDVGEAVKRLYGQG